MAMLSMKDIADAAGVSTAAVSYALNGRPGVSEKNRARILAVAKRLGYQPDAAMVKLMAHVAARRTHEAKETLALITDYGALHTWDWNPSLRALWEGGNQRAHELGYNIEEFCYQAPGVTPKRLRGILQARGIQGILFSMAPRTTLRLDFDFSGFACAMSGVCFQEPELNLVIPEHFSNTLTALEAAYARGYRRPLLALIGGSAERTGHTMEGGFLYFCSAHNDVDALPVYKTDNYEISDFEAVVNKLRPDVVLCTAGEWGRKFGNRVPNEFGWIGLDWSAKDIDLAGLDRRLHDQAGCVVDMVVASLNRHESGVPRVRKEVMVKGRFVEGPSLPLRVGAKPAKPRKAVAAGGRRDAAR